MTVEVGVPTEQLPWTDLAIPTKHGDFVDLSSLRDRFYGSEIGQAFYRQTPRFTKRHTDIPVAAATRYIGPDACPVQHQLELADIHVPSVLQAEYTAQTLFSPSRDAALLLSFVATFHDIGESEHPSLSELGMTTVGDIPCGEKTDEQRRHEAEIRVHLFGHFFPDIDPRFLERAEAIILHDPLPGDEIIHEYFEAAHDLQVLSTANFARERSTDPNIPDGIRPILGEFATAVTDSHLPVLRKRSYFLAVGGDLSPQSEQLHV